ncbi:hypothetical protein [Ornithinibacillus scapharcae]|uniref:hypothetical protein n=1 Tax=Ornithinibacillus scapharcae TaxID=1147159 RepID=UPI000225AE35|nr:hypothetical protein [Ornithinibacillus scapharcae]
MKKYFALFVLLSVVGQFFYSNHVSNFDLKHDNPVYIQEFELVNASPSEDSHPSYGDGNQKISSILNALFLGLVLTITVIFYHSVKRIKRLIQLYPVFYQGNYLIPTSSNII